MRGEMTARSAATAIAGGHVPRPSRLCRTRRLDAYKSPQNRFAGSAAHLNAGSCAGPELRRLGRPNRNFSPNRVAKARDKLSTSQSSSARRQGGAEWQCRATPRKVVDVGRKLSRLDFFLPKIARKKVEASFEEAEKSTNWLRHWLGCAARDTASRWITLHHAASRCIALHLSKSAESQEM